MNACARCGRSDETVLLRWQNAPSCPRCWARRMRAGRRAVPVMGAVAVVSMAVLASPAFAAGLAAGAFVVPLLGAVVSVAVVIAARWRLVRVSVGHGRPLLRAGRWTLRAGFGETVEYVPRRAVGVGGHRAVTAAPRLLLLAAGLVAALAPADFVSGAGAGVVVLSLAWLPSTWWNAVALPAERVAAMHAAVDVEEGRDDPAASEAARHDPSVAAALAVRLLDAGDPAAAADVVGSGWRDEAVAEHERVYAAAVRAWALSLVPGSDRDEAWAAAAYAVGTRPLPTVAGVAAFARVLLVSGYADDARVLAGEAARLAHDDGWYARAASLA